MPEKFKVIEWEQKADKWLPGCGKRAESENRGFTKGHKETFRGEGCALYLDCGDSSWIGWPDLASKTIWRSIKFEVHLIFFA